MTRYERISTGLAVIALVLAVTGPFVTYHLLDPQLQSFRHRGRLQVSVVENNSHRPKELIGNKLRGPTEAEVFADDPYEIRIANVGDLPAKDVLITAQYIDSKEIKMNATINPPLPMDTSIKDHTQFITLRRALAPHDTINLKFANTPNSVWVSNEVGETSTLINHPVLYRVSVSYSIDEPK
jgi:hypothetical protein